MIITRVEPFSVAKIAAAAYAIMGFFVGGLMALMSSAIGSISPHPNASPGPVFPFPAFGAAFFFIAPIFYGVMGFIFTLISAWVYNLLAGFLGGIEIEVKER